MVAKAGLGLIGLSAISVGGVAMTKPHWLGMDHMPEWHPLEKDSDFGSKKSAESGGYKGALGEKYPRYLVGVTTKQGATDKTSESWWEWAYRRLSKVEGRTGKFGDVKRGYAKDDEQGKEKALNQICKEAYGKKDGDFHTTDGTSNDKFKRDEVWKYCSVGGTQPQTISEFNTGKSKDEDKEKYSTSNAIGSIEDEKSKLLSINSEDNKWVWDLKDKDFQNEQNLGQGFFKAEKAKEPQRKIQDICKDAYNKSESTAEDTNKLPKTDVIKYCGL